LSVGLVPAYGVKPGFKVLFGMESGNEGMPTESPRTVLGDARYDPFLELFNGYVNLGFKAHAGAGTAYEFIPALWVISS